MIKNIETQEATLNIFILKNYNSWIDKINTEMIILSIIEFETFYK